MPSRDILKKRNRLHVETLEDRLPPGDLGLTALLSLFDVALPDVALPRQTNTRSLSPHVAGTSPASADSTIPRAAAELSRPPEQQPLREPSSLESRDGMELSQVVAAQPWNPDDGAGIQGGPEDLLVGPNMLTHDRKPCAGGVRGRTQSETAITVSGSAIVVGFNDYRGFGCPNQGPGYQATGWAYSLDYGKTFYEGGALPGRTALSGDPWLATGPDGTIYLASLYNGTSGLGILRGTVTEKGISWSEPTRVTLANNNFDKEALAVDPNTGFIYITYTRFGGTGGIWSYRSLDGGKSFEGPVPVRQGSGVQGSFPVVGPNGELYVAWNVGYPNNAGIGFTQSFNYGESFEPHVQFDDVCNFLIPGFDRGTHPLLPTAAVDLSGGPFHGSIYVAYATACYSGNGDVVLRRSDDGGLSWTDALLINDDGSDGIQWYPSVSVDAVGNVNVFFYDRRENPGSAWTNLYFAQSADGGQSFTNLRVTETASEWVSVGESPNYGDYINSVSYGTDALVAYADGRDGDPDTYFARVSVV